MNPALTLVLAAGPPACQWGSKTGSAASQPAVALCRSCGAPQPLTGRTENAQRAPGTVEGSSPAAPASLAAIAPAPSSVEQ